MHGLGLGLRLQLLFEQPFHALIELLHLGSLAQPGVTGHEAAVGPLVQLVPRVARVHHPSVAEVYDFDRLPDGRFLLAMEYVVGETVAQQLERAGPFTIPEAIRVLRTVADALNHVHWVGILHGDLKPQNIMLGPGGVVKLLDFGVAHEMAQLVGPDTFRPGTLAYMSPEQLLGDALGPASDIYALGVVFYEMLTGRLPHAGTTVAELRMQRLLRPPIPVNWLRPPCPRELAEVVARALHPEPAQRWPSAVAFAQAAARAVDTP